MQNKAKKIIIISIVAVLVLTLIVSIVYFFAVEYPAKLKKQEQLKQYKEYYAQKLINYNNENLLYNDYEVDIAFIGDSLIDGYDVKSYYADTNI